MRSKLLLLWVVLAGVAMSASSARAIAALPPPPPKSQRLSLNPRVEHAPAAALELDALARITGLRAQAPVEVSAPAAEEWAADEPRRTSVQLRMLGTMVSDDPSLSMVMLERMADGETRDYRVGDEVLGATIVEISARRVLLSVDGEAEFLDKEGPGSQLSPLALQRQSRRERLRPVNAGAH